MDTQVRLWDIRSTANPVLEFNGEHTGDITQCKFSHLQPSLFASSSSDRKVVVWDLSKGESFFVHGGHQAKVSDFSWNPNERLTIASTSEDNVLQVW